MIELRAAPALPPADWVLLDAWGAARDPSAMAAAVEARVSPARDGGVVVVAHEGGAPLGVVAVRESPWDAEGLAGPVSAVELLAVTSAGGSRPITERLADVVDRFSRDRATALDWVRVDQRDRDALAVLQERGFEGRGDLLTLVAPSGRLAAPAPGGATVRPASEADLPWASTLAAGAFTESRFRDPRGPVDWHRQVYGRWVASRFAQRRDDLQVLVALLDGEPAGFLIWKLHASPGVAGRIGQVDLVAVEPRARRRGVGRALFDEARRRSAPVAWMAADVYAANQAGWSLHAGYGLQVEASARYLHRWNRAP